jgi:hypothetical protein
MRPWKKDDGSPHFTEAACAHFTVWRERDMQTSRRTRTNIRCSSLRTKRRSYISATTPAFVGVLPAGPPKNVGPTVLVALFTDAGR